MKQKLLTKSLLLLTALLGGVSSAWADDSFNIPKELGTCIPLSTSSDPSFESYITTNDNFNLDTRLKVGNTYYTVGAKSGAKTVQIAFKVKATVNGDYVFGFKTGSNNGTSTVSITKQKSGDENITTITDNESVIQDGNWDPNQKHVFHIGELVKDNIYTITLTAEKQSGNYAGNFGLFYFHRVNQYPTLPTAGTIADTDTHIELSDASFYKSQYNNDKVISGLDDGGYMDNVLLYNNTAGYFNLLLNVKDFKANGTLTATIYDFTNGEQESTATIDITGDGDKTITLPTPITTGLKKLRFDFTGTKTSGTIFNYRYVTTNITKYSVNEDYNYTPAAVDNVDVELTRTLPANKWATIVLPFNVTVKQAKETFGDDVKLAQLTGINSDNMEFSSVDMTTDENATAMNANEPYMIFVPAGLSEAKTINGVTIVEGTPSKTTVSGIDFIGSYDATTDIPASDGTYTYYFVSDNKLYKTAASGAANTMKGTRAYFKVPGTAAARLKGFVFDNDETTGIGDATRLNDKGQKINDKVFFNLSGQRVSKAKKGLYIVGGKKMIVK